VRAGLRLEPLKKPLTRNMPQLAKQACRVETLSLVETSSERRGRLVPAPVNGRIRCSRRLFIA